MAVNIVGNFLRHRRRLRHFILKVGQLLICSQGGAQPIPHGHHRRAAAAADALNIIRVRHQGRPWRGAVAVLEQSVGIEHRVAGHENGGRLFVAAAAAASVEAEEADQAPDAAEQQHQEYERNRNPRDTHTDVPLADLTRDVDNRRVGQRRRRGWRRRRRRQGRWRGRRRRWRRWRSGRRRRGHRRLRGRRRGRRRQRRRRDRGRRARRCWRQRGRRRRRRRESR